jgi:hypothetical protein
MSLCIGLNWMLGQYPKGSPLKLDSGSNVPLLYANHLEAPY